MSQATRAWVCSHLAWTDSTQQSDLMNEDLTTTELIAFLQELLLERGGVWQGKALEVLAVNTDHPTVDGPDGHNGGNAIDLAPVIDNADQHLVDDIRNCEFARGIGLGGVYKQFCDEYDEGSKCFADNDTNHIHIQVVGY